MRDLLADPDDRVRIVAASWYEHHPDRPVLATLIERLAVEESIYVRPALFRAIAAQAAEPQARAALLPLVDKGDDVFRGAVITALAEARTASAIEPIRAIAQLDGPLQEDAIVALGRIGDRAVLPALAALQQSAPPERKPAIAAAVCLIGLDCPAQLAYLDGALKFAAGRDARMAGAVARALGSLAASGQAGAWAPLFDVGGPAREPDRTAIAMSAGLAAMRNPATTLAALETRADRAASIELIRDAFDLLSQEDYAQERFFRAVRQMYWDAAAGSPKRALAEAIISGLDI
jgi:hypothetical protein